MRETFINTLVNIAQDDERIYLLTGDLGFSVVERFRDKCPGRFYDMGVAEQNMIGVAAGLALTGKIVYVYSIVPFVTMRCFEQIRNDICFQNVNVRLIGIGGGVAYGTSGTTHYSLEDIAILRPLPNMTIVAPGDPIEAENVTRESVQYKGPMYIRLGKGREPIVHNSLDMRIGESIVMSEGEDIGIITCGSMLHTAIQVADILKGKNLDVYLISMPTIKPFDKESVIRMLKKTKAMFTIEEHSLIGGLGSAVSEVVAEADIKVRFKRFAMRDKYNKIIGCQKYLLEQNGLHAEQVVDEILRIIQ
jgi:transketolase